MILFWYWELGFIPIERILGIGVSLHIGIGIRDWGSSLHDKFIITQKLKGGKPSWFDILQMWETYSIDDVMEEQKSSETFLELLSARGKP